MSGSKSHWLQVSLQCLGHSLIRFSCSYSVPHGLIDFSRPCSASARTSFASLALAASHPQPHLLQLLLQCLSHNLIGFSCPCSISVTASLASAAPTVSLTASSTSAAPVVPRSEPHLLHLLLQLLIHSLICFSCFCSVSVTTSLASVALAVSRSQPHWLQLLLECPDHNISGFNRSCSVSQIRICLDCGCSVWATTPLSLAALAVSWS